MAAIVANPDFAISPRVIDRILASASNCPPIPKSTSPRNGSGSCPARLPCVARTPSRSNPIRLSSSRSPKSPPSVIRSLAASSIRPFQPVAGPSPLRLIVTFGASSGASPARVITSPARSSLPSMSAFKRCSSPSKSISAFRWSMLSSSGCRSSDKAASRFSRIAALALRPYSKLLPLAGSEIRTLPSASLPSSMASGGAKPPDTVSSSSAASSVPDISGKTTSIAALSTRSIRSVPPKSASGDQSNPNWLTSTARPFDGIDIDSRSSESPVQRLPSIRPSSKSPSIASATVVFNHGVIARNTGPVPAMPTIAIISSNRHANAIAPRRAHLATFPRLVVPDGLGSSGNVKMLVQG